MLVTTKYSASRLFGKSLRSNLRASTGDGAAYGVMVGIGETYFPAFAIAIGLGEVAAGLISSLPMLAGGLLQLVSLHAVGWIGSEKRWVLLCASVQGLAFIPLAIAGWYGTISLTSMLIIASIYWAAGLASGPAWNTWMQSVVPARVRTKYFAGRTRASQLATLFAFIAGGMLLQWSRGANVEAVAFGGLFATACLFRLLSVICLSNQESILQDRSLASEHSAISAGEAPAKSTAAEPRRGQMVSSRGWRLLAFLVAMQGMVQLSGPFFSPFLLEQLNCSYIQFVALIGVAFLSKGIAFSVWAKVACRRGAGWLMWCGALGIVPIASLWCVSQHFLWLLLAQIISGTVWAAYELGFFLMFFETLPVKKRTRMLTIYNFGNTSAWCLGAAAGAAILSRLGAHHETYMLLFAMSSIGRLFAITLLIRAVPPNVRVRIPVRNIAIRVLGLRPNSGGVDVPILPSIPSPPSAATSR